MRTNVAEDDDGPCVLVHREAAVDYTVLDATAWTDDDLDRHFAAETARTFDLEHDPLFRFSLLTRSATEHIFLLSQHHIVSDMWSLALLFDALTLYYRADVNGEPTPTLRASDSAAATEAQLQMLDGPDGARLADFWENELGDHLVQLDLATDRPRTSKVSSEGAAVSFTINSELTSALRSLADDHGTNLFTTVLAAYKTLLHRNSGQDELMVTTPRAGRGLRNARCIGYFVNPVLVRSFPEASVGFDSYLASLHDTVYRVARHDSFPFRRVTELLRTASTDGADAGPRAAFAWQKSSKLIERDFASAAATGRGGVASDINGMHFLTRPFGPRVCNQDLLLLVGELGDELAMSFDYRTSLFDRETIENLTRQFTCLLADIAQRPTTALGLLSLLDETYRQKVTEASTGPELALDHIGTFCQQFEQQAASSPDAIAVIDADGESTYADLNDHAERLRVCLADRDIGTGDVVALAMHRRAGFLGAVLAVHKAGAAYLALPKNISADNLAFMIGDSGSACLVTDHDPATFDVTCSVMHISDASAVETPSASPSPSVDLDTISHLSYSSDSSGETTAVKTTHGNVVNLLASAARNIEIGDGDTSLSCVSFDSGLSMIDLWLPLTHGGRVVIADEAALVDGQALADQLVEHAVTMMVAPSATWRMLIAAGWSGTPTFTCVTNGETLTPGILADLQSRSGLVWNSYGRAQTTTWSAGQRLDRATRPLPLGKPIHNTWVYLLDTHGQLVPFGVPGEIHIAGNGVTAGHQDQSEAAALAYFANPFHPETAPVMYRTGDLGRWRRTGEIEFLGRIDNQVAIRGQRIALTEIESHLTEFPGVDDAAVVAHELSPSDTRLVAYVAASGEPIDTAELRRQLRSHLPPYMLPALFVEVDTVPRTTDGKADRTRLRRQISLRQQQRPSTPHHLQAPNEY